MRIRVPTSEPWTVACGTQVGYFKFTKRVYGEGRRWLKMAPFHHHLELIGMGETKVVALAYGAAVILAIVAAYLGLISA